MDNCCYNRPYDDQSQLKISIETQAKLRIQRLIVSGELELVTSYVLTTENDCNTVDAKRENIRNYIDANSTVYVGIKNIETIDNDAEGIMQSGVKYMDACHVACARFANCDYFITTDRRLLKYKDESIRLLNPIDFIDVLNDENEDREGGSVSE